MLDFMLTYYVYLRRDDRDAVECKAESHELDADRLTLMRGGKPAAVFFASEIRGFSTVDEDRERDVSRREAEVTMQEGLNKMLRPRK
jgi:hypothetical protein